MTCDTCHWWLDWDKTHEWGSCVFFNGAQSRNPPAPVLFRVHHKTLLETRPTFGCVHWDPDTRKEEATQ
jgi:hypothetical protein